MARSSGRASSHSIAGAVLGQARGRWPALVRTVEAVLQLGAIQLFQAEPAVPNDIPKPNATAPLTEEQMRACTIGELKPLSDKILIADYDPRWPDLFQREAKRIRVALGPLALRIEHTGSTSVPGLAAKPIIDIVLVVADSSREEAYVPALEGSGYVLRIRETNWFEHRMFLRRDADVHLHVFSAGCPEIDRTLLFRDWLRGNAVDRDLYAGAKRSLAQREWKYMQNYADAKTAVIEKILGRASRNRK